MEAAILEAVREFKTHHDILAKTGRKRRMSDTRGRPGRGIAAETQRAVRGRTQHRCAFPGCTNEIWTEYSHRVPHSVGGGREKDDLDLLCPRHHWMYELGWIRIVGTPDAPVFTDATGRRLDGAEDPTDLAVALRKFVAGRPGEPDPGASPKTNGRAPPPPATSPPRRKKAGPR